MTRILTITSWYPPHHFGGYELSCFDVMNRFVASGHDVRVLCGDERVAGVAADADREARVFRELRPHFREGRADRPTMRARLAIERHNQRTLERHLAEFRPDVVSVWHMVAISMSLLRTLQTHDVPVVYVVCDNWPAYGPRADPWTSLFAGGARAAPLARAVAAVTGVPTTVEPLGTSGTFCFVSAATQAHVLAGAGGEFPRTTVVYSGIDRADFPAAPGADRPWEGRLLYVGRFDAWKGIDTLVRTLPQLPPETTLRCFGRGADAERARLCELAAALDVSDRVVFGTAERHELAAEYRTADVVVFPSEWDEPFGLVPLEAMACGTPVVATGVGGSGEFLRDGVNCVLFPPGDVDRLADALARVAHDGTLRRQIVQGGLRTAALLDVDELATTLELWHVAASERFAHGSPPHRTLDLPPRLCAPADRDAPRVSPPGARATVDHLLAETTGRVLYAGDIRFRLAPSVRVAGRPAVVASDPERRATFAVICERSRLPFRTGAFGLVAWEEALTRGNGDAVELREVARVLARRGTALISGINRADALARRARPRRAADRTRYTWRELECLVADEFRTRARHAVGWEPGRKRALASQLLRFPPLRRFSHAIVLETEPLRLDRDATGVVDAVEEHR